MNKKEKYIEKECKIHGLTKYVINNIIVSQ